MCPSASSAQPKTTPLAVVAGPDVPPPCGGAVCQRTSPVAASSPLHIPDLTTDPLGIVHGLASLLASAVYTRNPSTAEPHCRPPAVPPGPAVVTHFTSPVSGSSAQYWPLFWPAPTRSRGFPFAFTVNSAGICPKS